MATERVQQPDQPARTPSTMTLSDGTTVTLDDAYYHDMATARRARLAALPLSDEELCRRRVEYPNEAWLWTRETQDAIRRTDETIEAGRHNTVYNSDDEFQAALDRIPLPDADV